MHETHMQDWERLTFTHWQDLAKNVPSEETGLEVCQIILACDNFVHSVVRFSDASIHR